MIKCDLCEFRTPYKWNLDRHLKNHMGGGMYQCSLCNFTAHIKQSLTVHIQNHHLSPDKARSARRRNKVGASDQLNEVNPAETAMDADEAELLRLERMEHDARMAGMPEDEDEDEDEMADGEDHDRDEFLHPDGTANHGRNRFKRNENGGQLSPVNYSVCSSSPPTESTIPVHPAQKKLPPRPIPNLIPIAIQSVVASAATVPAPPTILKIPQIPMRGWDGGAEESGGGILEAVGLLAKSLPPTTTDETRKRKSGFLDQLAQKLAGKSEPDGHPSTSSSLTSAGSISWSSRCQHCRQRCKTRADLLSHLKQCPRALQAVQQPAAEIADVQQHPHPMENKVFVWNNQQSVHQGTTTTTEDESNTESETDAMMMMMLMEEEEKRPSSVAGSDVSEASLVGVETAPGIGAVTGGAGAPMAAGTAGSLPLESRSTVRRVYRCPRCSFWATTASRFHVHMVGHTNTKPFECSQCAYRSNWR